MEYNEATLDDNPFRYCGEYYDKETQTIYLRARYYSATQGRFTQEDPIRDGYNWYAYCGSNPIIFVDRNGLAIETVWDIISLAGSVFAVIANPTNPMEWLGLVGDVVDVVVPCLGGVGEAVRATNVALKAADAVDNAHDALKLADNLSEVADGVADAGKALGNMDEVADAVDAAQDMSKAAENIAEAADEVHDATKITDQTIKTERSNAVRKAWDVEYENVKNGGHGVSREWTDEEMVELLENGKVKGYHGHHMKSVKGYPDLAGDPENIQFLTRNQHLDAHGGNWRNITHERYID